MIMKRYYYFVVEGVHDVAAIGKILKQKGYVHKKYIQDVDNYWDRLIPKTFPFEGDLQKRVPVPVFYQNETDSISIVNSGGETNIPEVIEGSLLNLPFENLNGVAIFCDADTLTASEKFESVCRMIQTIDDKQIRELYTDLSFNSIKNTNYKAGIFVFPDNSSEGTLEDFLLLGGSRHYADLYEPAQVYLESIPDVYKKKWKLSSENKVLVGVMANVLKPGKANQVSIQDNNWITEESLNDTNQKELKEFIDELLI